MTGFISTKTGKRVALAVTVFLILGAVAGVIISNRGYRSIYVQDLTGEVFVTEGKNISTAYSGQKLKSGNTVEVLQKSNLTLALDTDKYVFADEMTKFTLEAVGKSGEDSRTVIHLENGSVLSRIDNKLAADEDFLIETPNSTMSVRGTVFGVNIIVGKNGEVCTYTNVYEGRVEQNIVDENGNPTGETISIEAGKSVTYETMDGKVTAISEVGDIDYSFLSVEQAEILGTYMDEGRIDCITKAELYEQAVGNREINKDIFDKGENSKDAVKTEEVKPTETVKPTEAVKPTETPKKEEAAPVKPQQPAPTAAPTATPTPVPEYVPEYVPESTPEPTEAPAPTETPTPNPPAPNPPIPNPPEPNPPAPNPPTPPSADYCQNGHDIKILTEKITHSCENVYCEFNIKVQMCITTGCNYKKVISGPGQGTWDSYLSGESQDKDVNGHSRIVKYICRSCGRTVYEYIECYTHDYDENDNCVNCGAHKSQPTPTETPEPTEIPTAMQ
ncbi:MAG: FecR domain-containing protein [Pseudobutyrivibrio sp.]|nr:FecR domain-containing protein [Pseudobutyrivibrio sp.]